MKVSNFNGSVFSLNWKERKIISFLENTKRTRSHFCNKGRDFEWMKQGQKDHLAAVMGLNLQGIDLGGEWGGGGTDLGVWKEADYRDATLHWFLGLLLSLMMVDLITCRKSL